MKLAGCVIKDSNNNVLLLHRSTPKRTQWEVPGGLVDPGETPEQAAVRELKEELDVMVTVVRHIGDKVFEEDSEQHAYFWYEATIQKGALRLTGSDEGIHDDFRYFSIEEMRAMFNELSANCKNFVEAVERKEVDL